MRRLFHGVTGAAFVLLFAVSATVGPSNPLADRASDAAALSLMAQPPDDGGQAELPRARVDIPALAIAGRPMHVPAGGDLQAVLDAAVGGDVITLAPDATYRGPFHLRRKAGDRWIVIAMT